MPIEIDKKSLVMNHNSSVEFIVRRWDNWKRREIMKMMLPKFRG